ncbi:hypothetical protein DERP_000043 [Dermatophagoides pteronyssinus]|uniref:Uncharacterized protein n=1 Tax=Dermatophagoides pteronyssinus TaxID=6956 RepID=A0ABQ8IZ33_DERPT|nr:hypothetical protein DERP_000043 [Dermatophagoides pteronyssinus]
MTDNVEQQFDENENQQFVEISEYINHNNDDNNEVNSNQEIITTITSFTEEFAFVIELFVQILLIYCLCYLSTMKKFLMDQIFIQPNLLRQPTRWPAIIDYFRSSFIFLDLL